MLVGFVELVELVLVEDVDVEVGFAELVVRGELEEGVEVGFAELELVLVVDEEVEVGVEEGALDEDGDPVALRAVIKPAFCEQLSTIPDQNWASWSRVCRTITTNGPITNVSHQEGASRRWAHQRDT